MLKIIIATAILCLGVIYAFKKQSQRHAKIRKKLASSGYDYSPEDNLYCAIKDLHLEYEERERHRYDSKANHIPFNELCSYLSESCNEELSTTLN